MAFIAISEVSKRYGSVSALRSVSLTIDEGSTMLLTGPNGAGKSTLLRLLAGLERPDSGSVRIAGYNLSSAAEFRKWKEELRPGVLAARTYLYGDLSVEENLTLAASLNRMPDVKEAVAQIVDRLNLTQALSRPARDCSQGMQRRASLARALVHKPKLVLLDEPLTNLDEESRKAVAALLRELKSEGATLVVSTHDPELLTGAQPGEQIRLERGALRV